MTNPITTHLAVTVCKDADDAIAQGFDWKSATPAVKPIELKKAVLVRNGTQGGNATVDFLVEDETGQRFVFMITSALLKTITALDSGAQTFQDRVRAEASELDERITKLKSFTSTETFGGLPVDEQERMLAQLAAMTDYSACLAERIQAFSA